MPTVLTDLAMDLGVSERTLRRFVALGLIRCNRPTPRTIEISPGERVYIRENWALLGSLLEALRTEPGISRAVVFGSTARGSAHDDSDIDLAVWLKDEAVVGPLDVSLRLSSRLGRKVQVVDMNQLPGDSTLRGEIERDGRTIVDRGVS